MPSLSPIPASTPKPTLLARGFETCADGTAGFAISVPDGWYANLRQGDVMACAFLAREPFDPALAGPGGPFVAPIRVTTGGDPVPAGTVVEELAPVPFGPHGTLADRWVVERAGSDWLVYVVGLRATTAADPAYLQLATRTDDADSVDALRAFLDRLTLYEPMRTEPAAEDAVNQLFVDADACADLERGIGVIFPEAWWTNTEVGAVRACTYFAPTFFELTEAAGVPDGVAVTLELVSGNVATTEEIVGIETRVVDGRRHPLGATAGHR